MNKVIYLIIGICLSMGISSCHMHGDEHADHAHEEGEGHSESNEVEYPTESFTKWTDKTEFFVEFPVLAVGVTSRFAAHFSSMETFKPIDDGRVTVELKSNGQTIEAIEVSSPNSPGLFLPELTPTKEGKYDLVFYISRDNLSDTIVLNEVEVYRNESDARENFSTPAEGDLVAFSKEQAWKIDFALAPVTKASIQNIIHTAGEVLPINSDESSISATTSGIITFKNTSLIEGQNISRGTSLFVVNNDQVVSANLSEKYAIVKANLQQSKKNLDRSEGLVEKGIISQKEYDERKTQYEVYFAEYQTLTNNYSAGGTTLRTPISGILKKINVVNGQYVTEGQTIATVSKNKHLIIEAQVSQQYYNEVPNIVSANIKMPWNEQVVGIEEYNGKLVNKAVIATDHYIPVQFKIDNVGGILPGTYLDIYLKIRNTTEALVIPKNALLREYDMYYVYVMVAGESFEKRKISTGTTDGNMVEISSGLAIGEMVVTKGVYAIKMASMSSSIPAHGHEH